VTTAEASPVPVPSASSETESTSLLGMKLEAGEGAEGLTVTEVDPSSEAARKGVKPGDLVVELAGLGLTDVKSAMRALEATRKKGKKSILLQVQTGDELRFLALSF
jgi:serine protease Do